MHGVGRSADTTFAQELLFRCALLPAIGGDAAAVAISGAVFGALHVTGGRNAAYAAWATVVGCLYGTLAVATHDGTAPMLAHTLANIAAAALWTYGGGAERREVGAAGGGDDAPDHMT